MQTYNDKCSFLTGVNTFCVVQNNRSVIDTMNKLTKRRKATYDSWFDGGESKDITVNSNGALWIKDIKDNAIFLISRK